MYRRLYRSPSNKMLGGVCGGLGEYFSIDPVIVRLIALLLVIATGIIPGIIVYILALLIIPVGPEVKVDDV